MLTRFEDRLFYLSAVFLLWFKSHKQINQEAVANIHALTFSFYVVLLVGVWYLNKSFSFIDTVSYRYEKPILLLTTMLILVRALFKQGRYTKVSCARYVIEENRKCSKAWYLLDALVVISVIGSLCIILFAPI